MCARYDTPNGSHKAPFFKFSDLIREDVFLGQAGSTSGILPFLNALGLSCTSVNTC